MYLTNQLLINLSNFHFLFSEVILVVGGTETQKVEFPQQLPYFCRLTSEFVSEDKSLPMIIHVHFSVVQTEIGKLDLQIRLWNIKL